MWAFFRRLGVIDTDGRPTSTSASAWSTCSTAGPSTPAGCGDPRRGHARMARVRGRGIVHCDGARCAAVGSTRRRMQVGLCTRRQGLYLRKSFPRGSGDWPRLLPSGRASIAAIRAPPAERGGARRASRALRGCRRAPLPLRHPGCGRRWPQRLLAERRNHLAPYLELRRGATKAASVPPGIVVVTNGRVRRVSHRRTLFGGPAAPNQRRSCTSSASGRGMATIRSRSTAKLPGRVLQSGVSITATPS